MTDEETVTIVDEGNQVIGAAPRSVMRAQGLIHRATYILVFNSRGEIFVQKRTWTKDIYPGRYDVAAGGVVQAGERYEASALRELEEELGVRRTSLDRHFDFFYQEGDNRVWGRVFSCVHDGPFTLQEEEVESGHFIDPASVLEQSGARDFTPDGLEVLERYMKERQQAGR